MPKFANALSGNPVKDIRGKKTGGFEINWVGLQAIYNDLIELNRDVGRNMEQAAIALAKEIKTYAQDNAPWEDQTFSARDGLDTSVERTAEGDIAILLFHTVDYGVFLENANGGAYAIIVPTMNKFAKELGARLFGASVAA